MIDMSNKELDIRKDGLLITRRVLGSHPYGFTGALVTGKRGVGKSCYALIIMHEIFVFLGYEPKYEAWNMALDHCLFNIEDIIKVLEDASVSDTKKRVLCWDDVGVHASPGRWFTDLKTVVRLKGITDMIRECTCGLIMTTPTQTGILNFLRSYDDLIIQISYDMRGGYYRNAKIYRKYALPSGKRLVYHLGTDHFSAYLPIWLFKKYCKKRHDCWVRLVDELKASVASKEIEDKKKMKRAEQQIKAYKLDKQLKKIIEEKKLK